MIRIGEPRSRTLAGQLQREITRLSKSGGISYEEMVVFIAEHLKPEDITPTPVTKLKTFLYDAIFGTTTGLLCFATFEFFHPAGAW